MNKITLTLAVVAFLAIAGAGVLFVTGGNARRDLEAKVAEANTRSSELQTKLDSTSARVTSLQQQLTTTDAELGEAKSRATVAEARVIQANRDLTTLRTDLTAKEQAEQAYNSEIAQLKRELVQTKLAWGGATPEDLENARATIATLEAKIAELEHLVAAATVRPGAKTPAGTPAADGKTEPAEAAAVSPDLNAQVVTVGPSNSFVVINYGSTQGAQVGQQLAIRRGTATLATVQISDVRESRSIAQVVPGSLRGALRKGDSAANPN